MSSSKTKSAFKRETWTVPNDAISDDAKQTIQHIVVSAASVAHFAAHHSSTVDEAAKWDGKFPPDYVFRPGNLVTDGLKRVEYRALACEIDHGLGAPFYKSSGRLTRFPRTCLGSMLRKHLNDSFWWAVTEQKWGHDGFMHNLDTVKLLNPDGNFHVAIRAYEKPKEVPRPIGRLPKDTKVGAGFTDPNLLEIRGSCEIYLDDVPRNHFFNSWASLNNVWLHCGKLKNLDRVGDSLDFAKYLVDPSALTVTLEFSYHPEKAPLISGGPMGWTGFGLEHGGVPDSNFAKVVAERVRQEKAAIAGSRPTYGGGGEIRNQDRNDHYPRSGFDPTRWTDF